MMGIERIVVDDYEELSKQAAKLVAQRIKEKPTLVLGLATGSTPIGLYERLVAMYRQGEIDWSQVTTFNLDEYCGLETSHPQSYRYFMDEHLFSRVNIDRGRTNFPSERKVAGYERAIKEAGGIDLQILGIGRNGHIGFNEPGSQFDSQTRVVELTETTIQDNARFFVRRDEVPRKAVTMGLETIMESREILLLASGANKAEVVQRMLSQKPSWDVPASVLQGHNKVIIMTDREAAGTIAPDHQLPMTKH